MRYVRQGVAMKRSELTEIIISNVQRVMSENEELTKAELARRLKMNPNHVSDMINHKSLSLERLEPLASALGITLADLVSPGGHKAAKPPPPRDADFSDSLKAVTSRLLDFEAGWEYLEELEQRIGLIEAALKSADIPLKNFKPKQKLSKKSKSEDSMASSVKKAQGYFSNPPFKGNKTPK